ncbi:Nucleotide-binding universal stress protein, UspA family [Natronorubrum sediminis]|uniref:Nucleotide-binding universal stress protein, UspA family n=1 Tax=Natronorubrum sediminis TaxID=640943 RepID=A0A1H6G4X7_9EURY|nr:universal stress protein [Natronorubrum sediminis]SEH18131.1 Nucleotide-binding universal stress protein, UspA family [Natronorubrum sediminis]
MKFLVAVDGSTEAGNALQYATDIAVAAEGEITVVHAVHPAVYDEGGSEPITTFSDAEQRLILENIEGAEERGSDVLDDALDRAEDAGVDVEAELLYGDPVGEIVDYAEVEGFDGIYVGHRGRTGRAELMLGSVAKAIVERATVPVTVVR